MPTKVHLLLIAAAGLSLAACGGPSEETVDTVADPAVQADKPADFGPPNEPPLLSETGAAYFTEYHYSFMSSPDAVPAGMVSEFIDEEGNGRLYRGMLNDGAPYYFMEFAGLLSAACDAPMPPENVIRALYAFDTGKVGATLSVQARASEPLYDYKVEGTETVQLESGPHEASIISRTYDGVDDTGEIHTYVDTLKLIADKGVLAEEEWGAGGKAVLKRIAPPESAFVQEMRDGLEDEQIGTCADLF